MGGIHNLHSKLCICVLSLLYFLKYLCIKFKGGICILTKSFEGGLIDQGDPKIFLLNKGRFVIKGEIPF